MNETELTKTLKELIGDRSNRAQLREIRAQLQKLLTAGAHPCDVCGNMPHGIHQTRAYEVGCLHCKDRRSFGLDIAEAVENWNQRRFYKTKALYFSDRKNKKTSVSDRIKGLFVK